MCVFSPAEGQIYTLLNSYAPMQCLLLSKALSLAKNCTRGRTHQSVELFVIINITRRMEFGSEVSMFFFFFIAKRTHHNK